jgi:long-chain acyl-CoA synthetase
VFVFEGTAELPLAQCVKEAFDQVDSCEHLIVITKQCLLATSVAESNPFPEHKTLGQLIDGQSSKFDAYPTAPSDTCAILYTSGTTGQPKGAELSHFNIYSNVTTTHLVHLPVLDFTDGAQKTVLITLPLFHTTGQTVQMNTNIYGGNRVVLLPRFEPQATLDTMVKEKVNFWIGVPTMYWALLKYVEETGYDISRIKDSMDVCTSGGAPMPVEVMKSFQEKFGVRVLEGYGLSETSPLATFNHFEKASKPGTVGQAIFGVDVRCFDENDNEVPRGERGEVVIRGTNVMKGYYKRPEATAEAFRNGWFHTGDIGIIDEDGYLAIVDRKKDMILRGGYNVYPRELEEIIITHPSVSLCAVIGVPDERLGEEVKAFVVLKQDKELTETEFIDWCKTQFAANKYPRYVEFRDSLPIGGTGKIFKRALREEANQVNAAS